MSYGDAYFYRPEKIDLSTLKGYRHVVGQSYGERALTLAPDVGVLMRYAIPQIEGPSKLVRSTVPITEAEMSVWRNPKWGLGGTWRNGATWTLAEFVDLFHKDEKNFLHDSTGKRLTTVSEGRTFYLIRPAYVAKQFWTLVAGIHKRDGWPAAVFIDNEGIWSDTKIREVLDDTPAQEYAGGDQVALYAAEWDAFNDTGRLIMPSGTLIFVNAIGDWFAERKIDVPERTKRVDGVMLEAYAPWLNMRKDFKPEHSLNIVKRAQAIVDAGKHLICVVHLSSADSPERRAYEYMRYLLIAGERTSCRLVVDGSYSGAPVRIPEMDLDLGKPIEPFSLTNDGRLFREFEHGVLVVDPKTYTYTWEAEDVDPRDAQIAALQQQVQGVLEREQQHKQMIEGLQQTVSDLQTRLAQPIEVKTTFKI